MIVGMHRSGTSLLASILQHAGLFIGDELLPPSDTNKKGYFENVDFYNFHIKAYKTLSLNVDGWDLQTVGKLYKEMDEEARKIVEKNTREEWGWKEPRTTLFLKYWENIIPNLKYIFVYRDPWDVADSLFRRATDQKVLADPIHAFKTWDFYNREIIKMYTKHKKDSIIVHTDDVISGSHTIIEEINTRFGFHLNSENIENIFDKDLFKASDQNLEYSYQTAIAMPEIITTLNELRTLSGRNFFQTEELSKEEMVSRITSQFIMRWHELGTHNQKIRKLEEEIKNMKTSNSGIKGDLS